MSTKTVTRQYVDGTTKTMLRKKQGRIPNPPELIKVPLTIYVLPVTKNKIEAGAREHGLSISEYGETALIMYDYAIYHSAELVTQ